MAVVLAFSVFSFIYVNCSASINHSISSISIESLEENYEQETKLPEVAALEFILGVAASVFIKGK